MKLLQAPIVAKIATIYNSTNVTQKFTDGTGAG